MSEQRSRRPASGDETVVVRRAPSAPPPHASGAARRGRMAAAAVLALAGLGAAGWLLIPRGAPPPTPAVSTPALSTPALSTQATPVPPAPVPPPAQPAPVASAPVVSAPAPAAPATAAEAPPPAPRFEVLSGDEAAIAAHVSAELTVFRFAPAPAIVVLDFPTLQAQGLTLNRVAALVEKAGQPHDRVLADAELALAVKAHGDTIASYYYGHDYTAAALARFFALADRDGVHLGAEEERLRALLRQLDWLPPHGPAALISLSRAGADADITPAARAAILHHELSHGAFFTEPRYAAYARTFWQHTLNAKERAALRHFLAADGYEPGDEELTVNEMQAYLMFTHDPDFFDLAAAGLTRPRRAQLEAAFRHGMPDVWIRAMPAEPPPPRPAAAPLLAPLTAPATSAPATSAPATSASCGPARPCR